MIGVERHESSNRAKATSSKRVRGVAGLSNMVREKARESLLRQADGNRETRVSEFQAEGGDTRSNPALMGTWQDS